VIREEGTRGWTCLCCWPVAFCGSVALVQEGVMDFALALLCCAWSIPKMIMRVVLAVV
jgi:hypothetical protein